MNQIVTQKISWLSSTAHDLAGKNFNLASPEQVSDVLFKTLNLPAPHQMTSKQKHFSTSEEDLLAISSCHPIVNVILDFRSLSKITSTYIDGIRPYVRPIFRASSGLGGSNDKGGAKATKGNAFEIMMTHAAEVQDHFQHQHQHQPLSSSNQTSDRNTKYNNKVHAQWNQTIVRTGRLSCSKPNLQNIPNDQTVSDIQLNPRSFFIPSNHHVFVSADYSQIEMRILAHVSKDKNLIAVFHNSGDIYKNLASKIFRKSAADISEYVLSYDVIFNL